MTGKWVECKTQADVDQTVAAGDYPIVRSGTWTFSGSATVWASGSATVRAYGSATVLAYDSATVWASGSATVWASGSATVRAYGSATVWASGSATVRAYGSATVRAYDSATVLAYDSATVWASGSATVRAYGSATVRAYGSATVRASGSATVWAYDSATVWAGRYNAVTIHGHHVKAEGGVHIVIPTIKSLDDWAEFHGVERDGDKAVVFKAVRADLTSAHGTKYQIGRTVTAKDYDGQDRCGGGLHFAQSPGHASGYDAEATRWLACQVTLAEAVLVDGDKVKAKRCKVLHEVDFVGRRIEP